MKALSNSLVIIAVVALVCSSGCGGDKFPVRPAKGKVVSNGKPVTVGSVTFTPIDSTALEAGKPASGTVGSDGTFTLSTFDRFDGAIVGKHRVQYSGAEEGGEEESEVETRADGEPVNKAAAKRPQQPPVVQKGEIIVEVTSSGPNDFTIEL